MRAVWAASFALAAFAGLVRGDGLNARAKSIGKYMGTEYNIPELSERTFLNIANNLDEFGSAVPGNEMKWDATEPNQNQFSYGQGDSIANNVIGAGQLLRCHTLVWHNQIPNWVRNGNWNNQTLIAAMQNHIKNVVTHWKGKCSHWDVVNEALEEDGRYRSSVFYNVIGEAFIPIAFRAAAAADPNVKLFYNDYNIELAGAKATGAQRIVKTIKAYGAKIDAVGLQAHLVVGQVPSYSQYQSNLKAFTDLGVDVAYTELDIRMNLPSSSQKLQQQATDYGNVIKACALTERCLGTTMWGLTDAHSWVPGTFQGTGDALPWSSSYQKKPAYTAILNAWSTEAPGGGDDGGSPPDNGGTPPDNGGTPPDNGGSCAKIWDQCGGNNYQGPTCCQSGRCNRQSEWYSQCIP